MAYHQNARLTIYSREQLARKVLYEELTLAKWVRRFREGGHSALGDRNSRPRHCPRRTQAALLEQVLTLRRLRWNGWRIARELKLSRATVSRVLRRAGMNRLRFHMARAHFSRFGFSCRRILTDHGPCYRDWRFQKVVRAACLKHRFTRPYTPRTHGKAERFIQTALREWAYARTYQNSAERQIELEYWTHDYNFHRPHA